MEWIAWILHLGDATLRAQFEEFGQVVEAIGVENNHESYCCVIQVSVLSSMAT